MELLLNLIIIFGLIVLNAILSMSEMAILSAKKARLQAEAKDGNKHASAVLKLLENPNAFLSTVRIGITLIGILAGVFGGAAVAAPIESGIEMLFPSLSGYYAKLIAYGLVIAFITYLSLVIGEIVPKRLALTYPEKISKVVVYVMNLISTIFYPAVKMLELSAELLLSFLPTPPARDSEISEDEIRLLVRQGAKVGVIEETEEEIVHKAFKLGDKNVTTVMTPRADVIWLDLDEPYESAKLALNSDHSRFPAAKGNVDNLEGIVTLRGLMLCSGDYSRLSDQVEVAHRIPSSYSVLQALESFKANGAEEAFVIDEHGGFEGVITTHDLLEALVGDLGEEENTEITRRADGSLLIDASMDIHEVFERLHLSDKEDHDGYHSLGGFVMRTLGAVPKTGDHFKYEGYQFEVVDMDRHRVDKVLVTPIKSNS